MRSRASGVESSVASRRLLRTRRPVDQRPLLAHAESLPALDDKGLVNDRQAFGQVGVLRKVAVAVADREDGRDELDAGLRRLPP